MRLEMKLSTQIPLGIAPIHGPWLFSVPRHRTIPWILHADRVLDGKLTCIAVSILRGNVRHTNLSAINILEDLVGLGVQLLLLPRADYRQCQFRMPRG